MALKVQLKIQPVKRELTRRNISQNGLAIKLGITSGYCSQLLSGVRRPSPDIRQKLMDVLQLPFESLFIIEDAEKVNQ